METAHPGDLWWGDVAGPHAFVRAIAHALLNGSSVALIMPQDVSWKDSLHAALHHELARAGSEPFLELIDQTDARPERLDVGRYLLDRFAPRDVAMSYRSSYPQGIGNYLIEKGVLSNRVLWAWAQSDDEREAWHAFFDGYRSCGIHEGLLVMEADREMGGSRGRIQTIRYDDYVTDFDVLLFASTLVAQASERSVLSAQLSYQASLLARVCAGDVEVAAEVLKSSGAVTAQTMGAALEGLAHSAAYALRGRATTTHVLRLVRDGNTDEIERRVWEAQVESLYSLVEKERLQIIGDLYDDLLECLENHEVVQHYDRVTEPLDVEIGSLWYAITQGWLSDVDWDLRSRIRLLRDVRNCIAHGHPISDETVATLLRLDWRPGAPHARRRPRSPSASSGSSF